MAKTKLQMQDISDVLAAAIEPFQVPPLVAAPFTQITDLSGNARQLPDPSKTIRPAKGVERIVAKILKPVLKEKGPNGENVFKVGDEDRIRFVGSWVNTSPSDGGILFSSVVNDFVEVTFHGTGLNLLHAVNSTARDFRVTIDGGSESANLYVTSSSILAGRSYAHNAVTNIANNLTLGLHTVKIRVAGTGPGISGFEVLNHSANIIVPEGRTFDGGKAIGLNAEESISHNSNFASGTNNGRGGRVVIYKGANGVEKALQPTDAAAAYLSLANHANEDVIRKINYKEFGANRGDDFSTVSGVGLVNRAFTLDDGTTTLVGSNINQSGSIPEQHISTAGSSAAYIIIHFVGTGLDIIRKDTSNATADGHDLLIDGTNVGKLASAGSTTIRVEKLVSGLPFGTHAIRIARDGTLGSAGVGILDFIVYGPKKPSVPEGAVELGEYYLMANYSANTVAGLDTIATGVLRKFCTREFVYLGAWGINLAVLSYIGGWETGTNTTTNYFEHTFMGEGFEHRAASNTGASGQIDILLNGSALTAANFPSATFSTYGGFSFNSGTGALDANNSNTNGSGFRVSGLPYGTYTVRFTQTGAGTPGMGSDCLDIITPMYYPSTKVGSLTIKPSIEIKQKLEKSNVDLSKAKAYLEYDTVSSRVINSYNIAAVLQVSTSNIIVYFERNFKEEPVIVEATSNVEAQIRGVDNNTSGQTTKKSGFAMATGAATNRFIAVAFGELEDEGD